MVFDTSARPGYLKEVIAVNKGVSEGPEIIKRQELVKYMGMYQEGFSCVWKVLANVEFSGLLNKTYYPIATYLQYTINAFYLQCPK